MSDRYPELYSPTAADFTVPGTPLTEAFNVCVKQRINAAWSISLDIPLGGTQWPLVEDNAVIKAGGQLYVIKLISKGKDNNGKPFRHAEGIHVFWESSEREHLPTITQIGQLPAVIFAVAFAGVTFRGNAFRQLSADEVTALGMTPVPRATDIDKLDKVNPLEVMQRVINHVKGELYTNGFTFALVEQLGKQTGVVFRSDSNLASYAITEDSYKLVTRLYPYGANSLQIDGGYIDSPRINDYPDIYKGFINFNDYKDKTTLLARAQMEFADWNYFRIDRPKKTWQLTAVDLWKLVQLGTLPESALTARLNIGDYALLSDEAQGVNDNVRIVGIEEYLYEARRTVLTLGDPPNKVEEIIAKAANHGQYYFSFSTPVYSIEDLNLDGIWDEVNLAIGEQITGSVTPGGVIATAIENKQIVMELILNHELNEDDLADIPDEVEVLVIKEYDPLTPIEVHPSQGLSREGDYTTNIIGNYVPRWGVPEETL